MNLAYVPEQLRLARSAVLLLTFALAAPTVACGGDDAPGPAADTGPSPAETGPPDGGPPGMDAGLDAAPEAGPSDAGRDARPDAIVDAGPPFDAGAAGEGQGFVVSQLRLALDGHALQFAAAQLNPILDDSLARGEFIALVEVLDVDDRFWAMDDSVGIAMYEGQDTDTMPGNNFSGMARLVPMATSLDATGHPRSLMQGEIASAQRLTGRGDMITLALSRFGTVEVHQVEVSVRAVMDESDPATVNGLGAEPGRIVEPGLLRGVVPALVLERLPNMTGLGTDTYPTLLRLIAGFFGREGQPDADLDGDGLERITVRGGEIVSCKDGDGTEITGASCVGDPRIADGYTVAFEFTAVTAVIVPLVGP